jgi:hypothetical protein
MATLFIENSRQKLIIINGKYIHIATNIIGQFFSIVSMRVYSIRMYVHNAHINF